MNVEYYLSMEVNYSAPHAVIKQSTNAANANHVFSYMIELGRFRLVKWIFNTWPTKYIDASLIEAARLGKLKILRFLHAKGGNILVDNNFPIRIAAKNGHIGVVRYLCARGANVRADNDFAIRWAACNGHLEVVQLLHSRGANVQADKNTAIRWAAEAGHLAIVQYLYLHGADIRTHKDHALRCAAGNGYLEMVKFLHSKGADINADNHHAMKWAAWFGHLEVVRYLHLNGGNIDVITHPHNLLSDYVAKKKWLALRSQLQQLAARIFVAHYDILPDADTIPTFVMEVLVATKA